LLDRPFLGVGYAATTDEEAIMATKVKRITTLTISLEAAPGALSAVYSAFKEAGVNILASWGYEMGPGQAQAHFYAADEKKAKEVLTKIGKKPSSDDAVYAEGDDKLGAYAELLAKIAKAGVNISATDAFAQQGRFAAVFFSDDVPALCKALGC
jgi:hypothetical protein